MIVIIYEAREKRESRIKNQYLVVLLNDNGIFYNASFRCEKKA